MMLFSQKLFNEYKDGADFNIDFCHNNFEDFISGSTFYVELDNEEAIKFDEVPNLMQIIEKMKSRDLLLDSDEFEFKYSVMLRTLRSFDGDGQELTSAKIGNHIHGELVHDGLTYFLVDSEWYQIHPAFVEDLNIECEELLRQYLDEMLITENST